MMLRLPRLALKKHKEYRLPEEEIDYVSIIVDYKEPEPPIKPIPLFKTIPEPLSLFKLISQSIPRPPKIILPRENTIVEPIVEVPKIANLNYNIPTRNDVAVILVFFDYVGSVRILMNYLFMREKLKLANIPVFTLELVMEGSKPKISDAIHVYGSSYLFQKEHLIRLLEKKIPINFTKLACLDADVLFGSPDWYDKLSILLDSCQIVQCFEASVWLDITYTGIQKFASSCLKVPDNKRFYDSTNVRNFHPGFAWAFTRKWYNKSGFYDLAVIGSGDTMFAYGIMGYPTQTSNYETRIYLNSYNKWKQTMGNLEISLLGGTILYHLYHGSIVNRQYVSRYSYFEKYDNVEHCLAGKNKDGVYELKDSETNKNMFTFFRSRDDDGLD